MEKKSLFMPINATSLAHYFGGACILPSCYYTNKPEDLQDRFNGLLLLSIHLGTKQTNCCLEIVLDEEERDDLIDVKNGWYLYEKPIPISRVKQILFTNKEQKDTTITNIRLGTAFIPENIISIVNTFESVDVSNVVCPSDIVINDLSAKQKTFDKILGGLAVMKVAHPVYMNYSENYFSTLSYFNRVIFNCLINANVRINDKLQPILVDSKSNKLHMYLYETITDTLLEKVAAEEGQIIQKDPITKLVNLEALDKHAYILAVLNTYGTDKESKKKRVDNLFLSRFSDGIKKGKEEGIALSYGISRGYFAFRNSYEHNGVKVDVKYKLDSLLDYYTIESVYQYVYNNKISGELPILSWVKRKNTKTPQCKTDYLVMDEYVIGKKKPRVTTIEYLQNLISHFFQDAAFGYVDKFIAVIRDTVYADTKIEIEEEQANTFIRYKEQIKAQYAEEVAKKQAEIDSLKQQLKATKRNNTIGGQNNEIVGYGMLEEPKEDSFNQDIPQKQKIKVIKEAFALRDLKKEGLIRRGRELNITFSKKEKVDDMVIKIITSHIDDPKIF